MGAAIQAGRFSRRKTNKNTESLFEIVAAWFTRLVTQKEVENSMSNNYAYLNTARYEVNYQANTFSHVARFRFEREQGSAPTGAQLEAIGTFFDTIQQVVPIDFAVNNAAWYPADSRTSLPAVPPNVEDGPPGTNFTGGPARAYQMNFQGKSTGGSRASLMIIGIVGIGGGTLGDNYRLQASEAPLWLPAALAALGAIPGQVAIDNRQVVWYPYVNIKPHDYWVKAVR